MSSGFGGRLMGFYASDCTTYYGTDPSTKTFDGLLNLNEDLKKIVPNKTVVLLKQGSEISPPCINQCDLCFTSPPYFDTEKYSDEETQSYQKYPTENLWLNGFLRDTLKNCYIALKESGKLIININDVSSAKNLTDGTVKIAEEEGFRLVDTLELILSSCNGNGVKTEPIFIFDKL